MTGYQSTLVSLCLVALTITVVLGTLEVAVPNYFLSDDNADESLPALLYNWKAVVQHRTIPLLNFHQHLGRPYIGQGINSVLYPPSYLATAVAIHILNNPYHTIDVSVIFHLIVAGVAMWMLLHTIGINRALSVLSSIIWITFPYIQTLSKSWIHTAHVAAYLPLSFWLLERLIKKPTVGNTIWLAIVKSLFFFQGHVHVPLIAWLLEGLYIAWRLADFWRDRNRRQMTALALSYGGSIFLLSLLIAPQLFPLLYTQQTSQLRSASLPLSESLQFAVSLPDFLRAQLFNFRPGFFHDSSSHILFANPFLVIVVLSAPFVLARSGSLRRPIVYYGVLAAAALLLSTTFFGIFHNIPILGALRDIHRHFLVFLFFALITSTCIAETMRLRSKRSHIVMVCVFTLIAATNTVVVWHHRTESTLRTIRIQGVPTLAYGHLIDRQAGRILTYRYDYHDLQEEDTNKHQFLGFNYATLFNLYHFGGYNPLISKDLAHITLDLNYTNNFRRPLTPGLLEYLSTWSVKYFVAENTLANKGYLQHISQLVQIYEDNSVLVFDNKQALPYAREIVNPATSIPVEFGINQLTLFPRNPESHVIQVSVAPLDGYKVYVDGEFYQNIKGTRQLLTLTIPAHAERVTLRYSDRHFSYGLILAGTACLIIMVLIGWRLRQRTTTTTP